jgi:hypothetical protein
MDFSPKLGILTSIRIYKSKKKEEEGLKEEITMPCGTLFVIFIKN